MRHLLTEENELEIIEVLGKLSQREAARYLKIIPLIKKEYIHITKGRGIHFRAGLCNIIHKTVVNSGIAKYTRETIIEHLYLYALTPGMYYWDVYDLDIRIKVLNEYAKDLEVIAHRASFWSKIINRIKVIIS